MTQLNAQNDEKGNRLSEYDNARNLSSTVSASANREYTLLQEKDNLGESEKESFYLHIGPLPPANELEKYERICPGAVERYFKMWETESEHRRQLERTQAENAFQIKMKELEVQEKSIASKDKDASMNFNMFGKSIQIKGRGQIVSAFLILAVMIPCIVGAFLENRFIFVVGAILVLLFVIFLKGTETTSEDKGRDQERKSEPDPLSEEYTITSRL